MVTQQLTTTADDDELVFSEELRLCLANEPRRGADNRHNLLEPAS